MMLGSVEQFMVQGVRIIEKHLKIPNLSKNRESKCESPFQLPLILQQLFHAHLTNRNKQEILTANVIVETVN